MKILDDNNNNNNNNNDVNGSTSSTVLSGSMSTRCGESSGCHGRDEYQILRVAGNMLNKHRRTHDNGCPPVWWLLKSQQTESLLLYGIYHKVSDP
jgi:hypothetical protein